jgi:hypothetical protein
MVSVLASCAVDCGFETRSIGDEKENIILLQVVK